MTTQDISGTAIAKFNTIRKDTTISSVVIDAVITAVVEWLVTKCMGNLTPADINSPNLHRKQQLETLLWWACKKAVRNHLEVIPPVYPIDIWNRHRDELTTALMQTGAETTSEQMSQIKVANPSLVSSQEMPGPDD